MDVTTVTAATDVVATTLAAVPTGSGVTGMVIVSVMGVINLASNIVTMFIPDSKVTGVFKPIVGILNALAGNMFFNKNAK